MYAKQLLIPGASMLASSLSLPAVAEERQGQYVQVAEIEIDPAHRDADAYKAHLETAHFKKYKATTEKMVKSLKLVRTIPILLGANARCDRFARLISVVGSCALGDRVARGA
jgi:hypothetical protein